MPSIDTNAEKLETMLEQTENARTALPKAPETPTPEEPQQMNLFDADPPQPEL